MSVMDNPKDTEESVAAVRAAILAEFEDQGGYVYDYDGQDVKERGTTLDSSFNLWDVAVAAIAAYRSSAVGVGEPTK